MVTLEDGKRVDEEMLRAGFAVIYEKRGAVHGDGGKEHLWKIVAEAQSVPSTAE